MCYIILKNRNNIGANMPQNDKVEISMSLARFMTVILNDAEYRVKQEVIAGETKKQDFLDDITEAIRVLNLVTR
jgi:hypothetical protein